MCFSRPNDRESQMLHVLSLTLIDLLHTQDGNRRTLSPFLPTKPEDVAALLELLGKITMHGWSSFMYSHHLFALLMITPHLIMDAHDHPYNLALHRNRTSTPDPRPRLWRWACADGRRAGPGMYGRRRRHQQCKCVGPHFPCTSEHICVNQSPASTFHLRTKHHNTCNNHTTTQQDCITLARSIAATEGVGERLVSFHTLDLLALEPALALLAAHAQQAILRAKDQQGENEGKGITDVVVFLYVYPTLLARLDALVDGLVRGLSSGPSSDASVQVTVVTLTYHFEASVLPHFVRRSSDVHDGRFVVYTLP